MMIGNPHMTKLNQIHNKEMKNLTSKQLREWAAKDLKLKD